MTAHIKVNTNESYKCNEIVVNVIVLRYYVRIQVTVRTSVDIGVSDLVTYHAFFREYIKKKLENFNKIVGIKLSLLKISFIYKVIKSKRVLIYGSIHYVVRI